MKIAKYETQDESNHLRYSFISKGESEITKVIAYQKLSYAIDIPTKGSLTAYNLAFGDKIGDTQEIDDKADSNNGDMRMAFNTVLYTIPTFFSIYSDTCVVVQGSDERRKRAYSNFVTRNYETLIRDYMFFGVTGTIFTPFIKGTVYDQVVFLPK